MTKPVTLPLSWAQKSDWATMQKQLKQPDMALLLFMKRKLFRSSDTGPHVQTCQRSTAVGIKVIAALVVALLTCQGWLLLNNPSSHRCTSQITSS